MAARADLHDRADVLYSESARGVPERNDATRNGEVHGGNALGQGLHGPTR